MHRARRLRRRALLAGAAAAAVTIAGCVPEPAEIEVTADEAPEGGEVPTDGGVSVHAVDPPDEVPPRDAVLFEGGWEEAAAWIAREADDGRPTLVNIFASWCDPCRREMPMLVEAADDNPDIAFLGIDHLDPIDQGRAFVEEFDIRFATIHDLGGDVAFAVGSRGMPTTVVFDRDGRLVGRVIGELTASSLEALLDDVR